MNKKMKIVFGVALTACFVWLIILTIVMSVEPKDQEDQKDDWIEIKSIEYADNSATQTIHSTFSLIYDIPVVINAQEYNDFPLNKKLLYEMYPRGAEFPLPLNKEMPIENSLMGEFFVINDTGIYYKVKLINIQITTVYIKIINSNEICVQKGNTQQTICSNYFNITYFTA